VGPGRLPGMHGAVGVPGDQHFLVAALSSASLHVPTRGCRQ